jgi:hypothetical protein
MRLSWLSGPEFSMLDLLELSSEIAQVDLTDYDAVRQEVRGGIDGGCYPLYLSALVNDSPCD